MAASSEKSVFPFRSPQRQKTKLKYEEEEEPLFILRFPVPGAEYNPYDAVVARGKLMAYSYDI